ncbi:MAG: 4-(cytidine 5'-diphospho)-2-C-methyl-D-erythritol kinase [Methylococcales bacterium]
MAVGGVNLSAWDQQWPAPAKLNLMLRIVGRRADGYHLLQTVFQLIDYCDYLRFSVRDDNRIVLTTPLPGVEDEDNLVIRAARILYNKATSMQIKTPGVSISVIKNLPMGGGLGGGSSDAATTLVGLNHLWGLQLSLTAIASLGLQLGADVPVFVAGNSAWAEGVGEVLQPIHLPDYWYVVVVPDCHVSTAEVFNHPQLTRDSESITIEGFSPDAPYNDCLSVVAVCYSQVRQALDDLAKYPVSGLTGTGGCVYASFHHKADAQAVAQNLAQHWRVFVAKAVNHSPLFQMLAASTQI